jgi:hypothetical protein
MAPAVFSVTNLGDNGGVDPAAFYGTGTLRQTIVDADATPGANSITFSLPDNLQGPGGWWTIQPLTALPALTNTVLVDGWSQAGAGSGLAPKVMLDGSIVAAAITTGDFDDLDVEADGCVIRGLAIGGLNNSGTGIYIHGEDAIQGCYVGLDPSGSKTVTGGDVGIWDDGNAAMIGGANPGEGNVISGNFFGIDSIGADTIIRGNRIGTNPAGTAAVPNEVAGISILNPYPSEPSTVGGSGPGDGNLISGNGEYGIVTGDNVRILGNLIGTDVTGTQALGNGGDGIFVNGALTNVVIGGTDPGSRNVISGNHQQAGYPGAYGGIEIQTSTGGGGVTIQGNYIGTDINGAPTLGNGREDIGVGSNCLIGGTEAGAGNLIADSMGVALYGSNDQVIGNVIFDNVGFGVASLGQNNHIIGNVIHDNGSEGVQIVGGAGVNSTYPEGNTVSANSIYSNSGLGIDLEWTDPNTDNLVKGVTLNDSAGHALTNHFQNFPDLTAVSRVTSGTQVTGSISSTPCTTFSIEFFANTEQGYLGPDGFYYGEGQRFLGSVQVTTDTNGYAPISANLGGLQPGEGFVTATATNLTTGDTSEFSQDLAVPAKSDQTILPNWPVRQVGSSTVTLNLTSTSGLPVEYAVSGPATLVSNVLTITGLGTVTVTASQPGDANFNPASVISTTYAVAPASLCGVLFKDFNGDGFQDYGELGAAGIQVQLTGADFNATPVSLSATTSASGYYQFPNLLPGTYTVTIPSSLTVTQITVGLNGSAAAVVGSGNSATGLAIAEGTVENVVNFGLQPAAGDALHRGQTAGIGFWNNKNGQALLKGLDGGTGTELGDWLASTLPHMFGADGYNLAGNTNTQVAAYFKLLFAIKGDKLEAQVLATALSVYVTNSTLAGGTSAAAYGFTVVANGGAGLATFNVGVDGAAVGQANGTTMTLMDILLAADQHATQSTSAAGFVLYAGDQSTRGLADDLFGKINDLGGI